MDKITQPFIPGELKENILGLNLNTVFSKKTLEEDPDKYSGMIMGLYAQIADVFIRNETKLTDSYVVLSAMADAVFTKIVQGEAGDTETDWQD